MIEVIYWASIAAIVETSLVFPATVLARGRWRPRPHRDGPVSLTVTVVVAAHEEAEVIGDKLRSVLDSDYPAERFDVVVASDGSTDGTVERALIDHRRIRVLDLPRVGKAAALNAAIACADGDILVFTDANSRFTPSTLTELLRPFADPRVGGVAGDQRYEETGTESGTAEGERRYWDLDRQLKLAESRGGNVIGATGALYAVRRDLVGEIPDGVTDDFTTSTGVIERGFRLVFAPKAIVHEPVAATTDAEFRRKVRVMTRGLQAVVHRRALLNGREHGFYAYQLLHHKVLRRLLAVPLAALLLTSIPMARRGRFAQLLLAAQLAVYGPGTIGLLAPRSRLGRSRPCGLTAYFCLVNAAGAVAAWNVLTGRRIDRWVPERAASTFVEPLGPTPSAVLAAGVS